MLTNVLSYVGSPELWLRSRWHLGWEISMVPAAVVTWVLWSMSSAPKHCHFSSHWGSFSPPNVKTLNQVFYFLNQLRAHYLENYKSSCILPYDSRLTVFDGLGHSEQSFCLKEWSRFSSVCCLLCWSLLCSVGLLQNLCFNGNLTKSLLLVGN